MKHAPPNLQLQKIKKKEKKDSLDFFGSFVYFQKKKNILSLKIFANSGEKKNSKKHSLLPT